MALLFIILTSIVTCTLGDVSHILPHHDIEEPTTPPPPPRPYAFGYAAGRFPGHIDRTHSEISDGSGVVQGSFSYVDPRHQIRTVDYVADQHGFHPILNKTPPPLPSDSVAVAKAKERHYELYARIANAHAYGTPAVLPQDSASVERAKAKHYNLYQKIAEDHARIAAEQEAIQATAEPNTIDGIERHH